MNRGGPKSNRPAPTRERRRHKTVVRVQNERRAPSDDIDMDLQDIADVVPAAAHFREKAMQACRRVIKVIVFKTKDEANRKGLLSRCYEIRSSHEYVQPIFA